MQTVGSVDIGTAGADFAGFAASGIAVADLSSQHPGPEVIVTTANGELAVFSQARQVSGEIVATPIWRMFLEGSVGIYNTILVDDLVAPFGKPEIYLAGSSGIRRVDVQ